MDDDKRKKFWIDPSLQTYILCYVLALLAGSLLIVYLSIDSKIEETGRLTDSIIISVDSARRLIREPMYLSGGIVLLAGGILTLLASHRIIGPIMVLMAGIRRVREGDLTEHIHLRNTDSLTETVRDFSKLLAVLREKVEEDRRHVAHVDAKLMELASKLRGNHKSAEEIDSIRKELKKISSYFRT